MTKNYSLRNYFLFWFTMKYKLAALWKWMSYHPDQCCIWSTRYSCEQTVACGMSVVIASNPSLWDFFFSWRCIQSTKFKPVPENCFPQWMLKILHVWVVVECFYMLIHLTLPHLFCDLEDAKVFIEIKWGEEDSCRWWWLSFLSWLWSEKSPIHVHCWFILQSFIFDVYYKLSSHLWLFRMVLWDRSRFWIACKK